MAQARQYTGVFEGIDFPDYEYQHYPLMMTKKGEGSKTVENEDEEAEAANDGYVAPKVGKPKSMTEGEVEVLENRASDAEARAADLEKQLAVAKAALAAKAQPAATPAAPVKAVPTPAPTPAK